MMQHFSNHYEYHNMDLAVRPRNFQVIPSVSIKLRLKASIYLFYLWNHVLNHV